MSFLNYCNWFEKENTRCNLFYDFTYGKKNPYDNNSQAECRNSKSVSPRIPANPDRITSLLRATLIIFVRSHKPPRASVFPESTEMIIKLSLRGRWYNYFQNNATPKHDGVTTPPHPLRKSKPFNTPVLL